MTVGPGAVCSYLVCKVSAQGVGEHQDIVVDPLEHFKGQAASNFVVELICVDLCHHVAADGRIVRVADDLAAKENLHERVGKTHANCVDEHIARGRLHGLYTGLVVGDKLPEKRKRRIPLSVHLFV